VASRGRRMWSLVVSRCVMCAVDVCKCAAGGAVAAAAAAAGVGVVGA
jgi:hypothetical protein